jgi:F0F1-type ATP synthase assembly protein I
MADDPTESGLRGRDLIGLGGLLVGGVVGGMVLGLLADDAFGSSPVGVLVGVGVGVVLGCAGFVVRVRNALRG